MLGEIYLQNAWDVREKENWEVTKKFFEIYFMPSTWSRAKCVKTRQKMPFFAYL